MQIIYNTKLTLKFLAFFLLLIAVMAAIGILGIINMKRISQASVDIYHSDFLPATYIETIDSNIYEARLYTQKAVIAAYAEDLTANIQKIETLTAQSGEYLAQYEAVTKNPASLSLIATLRDNLTKYREERSIVLELARAGQFTEADDRNTQIVVPLVAKIQADIRKVINNGLADADESVISANHEYDSAAATIIIVVIIAAVVTILLDLFLSSIVTRPIKIICEVSKQIAAGDLTVTLPPYYLKKGDEIGILANNIEQMKQGLIKTVADIKGSSDSLGHQVVSISETLNLLGDRINRAGSAVESLNASMEETGAAAEEMNATAAEIERAVETVAEKATEGAMKASEIHSRADQLGKTVNDSITRSNRVFGEIKTALEQALADSRAVDEINTLADAILGITSQTTLLALNASIEAARAGEAGKGFAVVANEISALADNSKNTVGQIQAITKVVMSAVNALAESSSGLLHFVTKDILGDYQDMREAARSYTTDAVFVSDMTGDLSATAEELLAATHVLLRAINEVAAAAQDGAASTSTIAVQAADISSDTTVILGNMQESRKIFDKLVVTVDRFKLYEQ